MILYHVTPVENLDAIRRDGLLPRWGWVHHWHSPRSLQTYAESGKTRVYEQEPVHLAEHADPAFIADLHDVTDVAVLAVNVGGVLDKLRLGQDGLGTWDVYEWIRPEWIVSVHLTTVS